MFKRIEDLLNAEPKPNPPKDCATKPDVDQVSMEYNKLKNDFQKELSSLLRIKNICLMI